MAIDTGLASLSETLWTVATGTYMLAVVAYTGEYAFGRNGRNGRIAQTSPAAERSRIAAPAFVREPAPRAGLGPGTGNGGWRRRRHTASVRCRRGRRPAGCRTALGSLGGRTD